MQENAKEATGSNTTTTTDKPAEQTTPKEANSPDEKPVQQPADETPEPITLKVAVPNEARYNQFISPQLIEKFPNITFEPVYLQTTPLNELTLANKIPDLLHVNAGTVKNLMEGDYFTDLDPFIKKYKFDMSNLSEGIESTIRSYTPDGQMILMPFIRNLPALYYNKELFDKFGVDYPTDGMTWDEVYELARDMTRVEGGIKYHGFNEPFTLFLTNQLSPGIVDPATNKAIFTSDGWRKYVENQRRFNLIPDNLPDENTNFIKNQNIAMWTHLIELWSWPQLRESGIDWNMVTYPQFSDLPGVGHQFNYNGFMITPTSKHKEEAFQVLQYLMSEEGQDALLGNGLIPVLKSFEGSKIKQFDPEYLKDKNVEAIFDLKLAEPYVLTDYDNVARPILTKALQELIVSQDDILETLRKAEEEANAAIAAAKNAAK